MPLTDQTLSSLTAALSNSARAYRAAADKVASDFGLSQATGLPVLVISRFGESGVRPGVLADTLSLEASSLVRIVDQLIESKLVERHDDPQDRRAKILRLTEEGLKTAALMDQALTPFRRTLFGAFDPADVEGCVRVLTGLPAAIAALQDQAQSQANDSKPA
ncbi:MarR family winged helix-turn-helix transcriptional regulator [Massilia sp. YIM B02763]|uniref:MarR family winged helix-turn-helix transcriptional regulator n=1 Tax=Massilia sp. YIM B02763 TaxID=3050130 RepID=UPI0025B69272|nr:MarR family winged helix-turn-helix transcriptional regulator [Massilia sp. YIM B02763]MDN4053518.1 MarR family winged helix-turn-helix transcriptional regulator [Massilia sp. YIM B02763]